MITVVNVRTATPEQLAVGHYIGRRMLRQGFAQSPLANPFKIDAAHPRDAVIAQYEGWLRTMLEYAGHERDELERLTALAEQDDLVLLCWCSPERCHGDIVQKLIEKNLAGLAMYPRACEIEPRHPRITGPREIGPRHG